MARNDRPRHARCRFASARAPHELSEHSREEEETPVDGARRRHGLGGEPESPRAAAAQLAVEFDDRVVCRVRQVGRDRRVRHATGERRGQSDVRRDDQELVPPRGRRLDALRPACRVVVGAVRTQGLHAANQALALLVGPVGRPLVRGAVTLGERAQFARHRIVHGRRPTVEAAPSDQGPRRVVHGSNLAATARAQGTINALTTRCAATASSASCVCARSYSALISSVQGNCCEYLAITWTAR